MSTLLRRLEAGRDLTPEEVDYLYCIDPTEFLEIAALVHEGWELVDDAPIFCLAPAAWQPEHRTWVEDRLPHIVLRTGWNGKITGASLPERDLVRDMVTEEARHAGLPPPPEKRLWLLRSPWPGSSVAEILEAAAATAAESLGGRHGPLDVYHALVEMMAPGSTRSV